MLVPTGPVYPIHQIGVVFYRVPLPDPLSGFLWSRVGEDRRIQVTLTSPTDFRISHQVMLLFFGNEFILNSNKAAEQQRNNCGSY